MIAINKIVKELIKMQKITWNDAKYLIELNKKKLSQSNILHIFQLIQNVNLNVRFAIKLAETQNNLIEIDYLTSQQVAIISHKQEEQTGCGYYIFKLIEHNLLTIQEAIDLNEEESYQLSDHNIIKLIIGNFITLREVLKLEDYHLDALSSTNIFSLIYEGTIKIENILTLTEKECDKLIYNENVIWYINKKKITLQEIVQLDNTQLTCLEELMPLIEEGYLSIEKALTLTDYECYYLLDNKKHLMSKQYMVEDLLKITTDQDNCIEEIIASLDKHNLFTEPQGSHLIELQDKYLSEDNKIFFLIRKGYFNDKIEEVLHLIVLQSELIKDKYITKEEINIITNKTLISISLCCKLYNIFKLIKQNYLTVAEALNLSNDEIDYLSNKNIFKLIMNNFIKVKEILQLSDGEVENLSHDFICELIYNKDLTIHRAKHLSSQEYSKLDSFDVSRLIMLKYITCEEIFQLTDRQLDNLKGYGYYAITEGFITLKYAIHLSKYQFYSLSISFSLLKNNKITLEEALDFLKIDQNLEKLIDEFVPIDENRSDVPEHHLKCKMLG